MSSRAKKLWRSPASRSSLATRWPMPRRRLLRPSGNSWRIEGPSAMHRAGEEKQRGGKVAEDLEPYRRLIGLQKQMIALSHQHERAKRERDTLREEVAREVADHLRTRKSL